MRPIIWSAAAQRDVAAVYRYLAQFDPPAARRVTQGIYDAAELLARHPHAGREVADGRRELVVAPYVIVYRAHAAETRILRVWHGAQDRPDPR